jgi:hypothetical protein
MELFASFDEITAASAKVVELTEPAGSPPTPNPVIDVLSNIMGII